VEQHTQLKDSDGNTVGQQTNSEEEGGMVLVGIIRTFSYIKESRVH
jgi:hypothetical protein